MRTLIAVLVLALAAAGGWYFYATGGLPRAVATVAVTRGSAAEVVYATGVVEPLRWAKVIAYQRKRIVDICRCEGKNVKTGDVLARLDDSEERATMGELEARRRHQQLDIERIRGLVARNFATQTSLDELITQSQEYDSKIAAQRERIDDLVLRAPMDGTVLRRDGEIGEMAGTGVNDILFWVGQPRPLQITADVNEEDVPRVAPGQKVLLRNDGFGSRALAATVADITPKGDPATKTFRVHLALPDDTPLQIGMSVEANIVTREKFDVLLVPAEAVADGAVFRVRDGRISKLSVTTGLRGTRMVEIVQGLSEGERIVTPAPNDLAEGARVRVEGAR
jgi:membrane fusion protein (multidrug efflux system)